MSVDNSQENPGTDGQTEQSREPVSPENTGNDSDAVSSAKTASLNLVQVIGSVFAAGLGVQSSKNRERDFKQGRAGTFIIAGLLFTALFIGTVYTVVSLVLSSR